MEKKEFKRYTMWVDIDTGDKYVIDIFENPWFSLLYPIYWIFPQKAYKIDEFLEFVIPQKENPFSKKTSKILGTIAGILGIIIGGTLSQHIILNENSGGIVSTITLYFGTVLVVLFFSEVLWVKLSHMKPKEVCIENFERVRFIPDIRGLGCILLSVFVFVLWVTNLRFGFPLNILQALAIGVMLFLFGFVVIAFGEAKTKQGNILRSQQALDMERDKWLEK